MFIDIFNLIYRSSPITKNIGDQQSTKLIHFKNHAKKQDRIPKKMSILDILNHPRKNNKKNNGRNIQDADRTTEPLFVMEARAPQIRQEKISQPAPSNLIYPPFSLIMSKSWSF